MYGFPLLQRFFLPSVAFIKCTISPSNTSPSIIDTTPTLEKGSQSVSLTVLPTLGWFNTTCSAHLSCRCQQLGRAVSCLLMREAELGLFVVTYATLHYTSPALHILLQVDVHLDHVVMLG